MGVNESLCLSQYGLQTYKWCFYQAIDPNTMIVQFIFLFVLIAFSIIFIKYFMQLIMHLKTYKYKQLFGNSFLYIYLLVAAWTICSSIIKAIINIVVYYQLMDQHASNIVNPEVGSPIVFMSSIFFFFDSCCGFFLLFLMLLIPYQWAKQLLMNTNQMLELQQNNRYTIDRFFTFLKVIKFYFKWVRVSFMVLFIAQPFILFFAESDQNSFGCNTSMINSYLLYFDTFVILVTFIFAYKVGTFMQRQKLIKVSPQDVKRIRLQFFMLVSILLLRFIANFIFKLLNFRPMKINSTCRSISTQYDETVPTLVYQVIGLFILHFSSVAIIVYIYKPDVKHRKRDEKILNGKWSQNYDNSDGHSVDQIQQQFADVQPVKPSMLSVHKNIASDNKLNINSSTKHKGTNKQKLVDKQFNFD